MFNPLPNDSFLGWTKLKAVADDKLNACKIKISVLEWRKNFVGKGENAGFEKRSLDNFKAWSVYLQSLNTIAAKLLEEFEKQNYQQFAQRKMDGWTDREDGQTGLFQHTSENPCIVGL